VKNNKQIAIAKRIIALLIASILLGISVNLYIFADLGSDSITVFEDGIHTFFHVSMGTSSLIYNLLFFSIACLTARQYIGLLTVAFGFVSSPAIDLLGAVMNPLSDIHSLGFRWIELILAIMTTSAACAILIVSKGGMNTLDAISTSISKKSHLSFRLIRTISDGLLLCIGWLLGGKVGIGSVPAVLLTGTTISLFVKSFEHITSAINRSHEKCK
jgi:uncharacterized membrane protein YczE